MKRLASVLVLALAALAAPTTASADAPDIRIAGFQFTYAALFENGGVAGYISVPLAPPVYIGGAASTNGGASTSLDEGIADIVNSDRIGHTFTECTAECDTAVGVSINPTFDISVPAATTVSFAVLDPILKPLKAGRYTFMCMVHKSMRGEITFD